MSRLTTRNEHGGVLSAIVGAHPIVERGRLLLALAAYEDTGLTPEEVAEYARAKDEGRLVVLPCKIRDSIKAECIRPFNGNTATFRGKVHSFAYAGKELVVRVVDECGRHVDLYASDFGETVFIVREAAEAAPKGREEEEA